MNTKTIRLIAAAAACAAFLPATALAAPKRARLTVEVKVEGTEGVVGTGTDRTSAKFREGYSLVTYVESDGELAQFNSKDPEYAQKMMGLAQGVHAKVNKAQGKAPVKKMTQQQIQDYVKTKQAACGADQGCLMKLAMEAQELMSNMDVGGATAAGNAGAYTGDEPPRFLNYFGFEKCGATSARVRRSHHAGHARRHVGRGALHRRRHRRLSRQSRRARTHLRLAHARRRLAGRLVLHRRRSAADRQRDVRDDDARQNRQIERRGGNPWRAVHLVLGEARINVTWNEDVK